MFLQIPSWYTAGMPPPLGGTDEDDGAADTSSSSDEADTATLADAQTDWSIVQGRLCFLYHSVSDLLSCRRLW